MWWGVIGVREYTHKDAISRGTNVMKRIYAQTNGTKMREQCSETLPGWEVHWLGHATLWVEKGAAKNFRNSKDLAEFNDTNITEHRHQIPSWRISMEAWKSALIEISHAEFLTKTFGGRTVPQLLRLWMDWFSTWAWQSCAHFNYWVTDESPWMELSASSKSWSVARRR